MKLSEKLFTFGMDNEDIEAAQALENLAEACGGLIGNYGSGRERGLAEIPSEVLGSILGAMQNIKP